MSNSTLNILATTNQSTSPQLLNSTTLLSLTTDADGKKTSYLLYIVLIVSCGICLILFVILFRYLKALRKMDHLRNRLISLQNYDSAFDGDFSSCVKTPDEPCNNDPLLMFSVEPRKTSMNTLNAPL